MFILARVSAIYRLRFASKLVGFRVKILQKRKIHDEKVYFSRILASGTPHLGNHFSHMKVLSQLLKTEKNCFFSIVDIPSHEPKLIRYNINILVSSLIASGVNPETCTFFLSSQVPQHSELAWILGCFTTMSQLSSLPSYKLASNSVKEVPLQSYVSPLLMGAEILLYKSTDVLVNEDKPEYRFTKELAKNFNGKFKEIFPIPALLTGNMGLQIRSLKEPDNRMSRSALNAKNYIGLIDNSSIIAEKIKKATTDFNSKLTYDFKSRPGVSNLILMHSLCTGISCEEICQQNQHLDTGQYKIICAKAVNEYMQPLQTKINDLMSDPLYISEVLKKGSERAEKKASKTITEVKETIGLSCFNNLRNLQNIKLANL